MLHFPLDDDNRACSNEKYDIYHDFQEKIQFGNTQTKYTKNDEFIKHPFVLYTLAYHKIMRQLNQEKQSIIKQIVLWKKKTIQISASICSSLKVQAQERHSLHKHFTTH